jgi:beta-1,4-mannosyl-glycoprotein beta-1,4-N-acetylglucosaminyltransferase
MTFFNELDLLEIRLNELDPYVDFFVISEAGEQFDGTPKPLFYFENRDRFEKFNKKIINIKSDHLEGVGLYGRAAWQAYQIMQGLKECNEEDVILFSDGDEIPRGKVLENFCFYEGNPYRSFHQPMFMFYVNWLWYIPWTGTVAMTYRFLKELDSPQQAKLKRRRGKTIFNAGWHFSQTGGAENVMVRLRNNHDTGARWAMAREEAANNLEVLKKRIEGGQSINMDRVCQVLPIDGTFTMGFPEYLVKNQDRFKSLIGGPVRRKPQ